MLLQTHASSKRVGLYKHRKKLKAKNQKNKQKQQQQQQNNKNYTKLQSKIQIGKSLLLGTHIIRVYGL